MDIRGIGDRILGSEDRSRRNGFACPDVPRLRQEARCSRLEATSMIVGVPRESFPGERRVALVPAVVPNLMKAGLEVVVEAGAGTEAGYPDQEYTSRGAKIVAARAEVFAAADIVVQ